MPAFAPGLVHTPVTPFDRDNRIDFDRYAKLIDFHIAHGADALALPMHAGESVSLSDAEKRTLTEFAIKHVAGRVPVIAHASDAGTAIAAALARHAQDAGAAAVIATVPYYWTPPPAMVIEHFAQIGAAISIPFYLYNSPEEFPGTKISSELCCKLIGRLPNFSGVVDLSLDWQFMIELLTDAPRLRPDFALIAGTELMVSAAAIGATGLFAPLAAIAPRLVRTLYDLCREQKLFEARPAQEEIGALRQLLKKADVAHLKSALRFLGRDCGAPRPPLLALDPNAEQAFARDLALPSEPRGW